MVEHVIPQSHLSNLEDILEKLESTLSEWQMEYLSSLKEDDIYKEQTFTFTGLDKEWKKDRTIITAYLESEEGDTLGVTVIGDIGTYLKESQYAGAIYHDRVKTEVNANLVLYSLEEDVLNDIHMEVIGILSEDGIRFYED